MGPSRLYQVLLIACWFLSGAPSCEKEEELLQGPRRGASFSNAHAAGKAMPAELDEVSGIAGSLAARDLIWAHNDSGDPARIFAMTEKGAHLGRYYLQNVKAVDWEDMASGPGPVPGKNYLYIGDIGDNAARRAHITVYRVEEPRVDRAGEACTDTIPEEAVQAFRLEYPGGPRDAEALIADPLSGCLYILTKGKSETGVYKVELPEKPAGTLLLQPAGTIPFRRITAGDISARGDEVLVKNYNRLFYWKREGGEPLEETFIRKARRLPYAPEPQGEALAWKKDGSGFFTLSEEALGIEAVLYRYDAKAPSRPRE
ncbi:MAG TPA: hypothetical protein VD772_07150 [Anseongella sp.]|nr:hypothetical protein [Anseongella sp.]